MTKVRVESNNNKGTATRLHTQSSRHMEQFLATTVTLSLAEGSAPASRSFKAMGSLPLDSATCKAVFPSLHQGKERRR